MLFSWGDRKAASLNSRGFFSKEREMSARGGKVRHNLFGRFTLLCGSSAFENREFVNQLESDPDMSDFVQNIESDQNSITSGAKPKLSHNHGHHHHDQVDAEELDEESIHFNKIVDAFLFYRRHAELKLASKVKSIKSIPSAHLAMIPKFRDHIRHVHRCVIANYAFLKSVITSTGHIFENRLSNDQSGSDQESNFHPVATDFNMDKLHSTLRQIVRDWSKDGKSERDQCYQPVLDQLQKLWPDESNRKTIRILVPGAGLGRLAFDIAHLGFECQGNEFSLFMLFVSNFILNRCKFENEWTIFPYVHQWTNNWSYDDQIRSIQFPDVNPSDLPSDTNFSMAAGDFLDVYGGKKPEEQPSSANGRKRKETSDQEPIDQKIPDDDGVMDEHKESWDGVVTVFFIDTAHNVIEYLETIYKILKPGGYWINLGPLLYHFSDIENEISIELPYEEILEIGKKLGLEILMDEKKLQTSYTQNALSMLQYQYNCAYTVFRKVPTV